MVAEFSGALREAVGVEQWTPARDDSGDDAGAWTAAGPAWAALVPVDVGVTALPSIGERRVGRPRFRLTLRATPGVGVTSRFRWRDRVLAVLRVEPDPRTPDRMTLLVEDRT